MDDVLLQFPALFLAVKILGTLAVLGSIYVKITPHTDDDTKLAQIEAHPIFGYILRVLRGFSLVRPRD